MKELETELPDLNPENPENLYRDPPDPSEAENHSRLHFLAQRHKRKIYALLLLAMSAVVFSFAFSRESQFFENFTRDYFNRHANEQHTMEYQIDGYHFDEISMRAAYAVLLDYTYGATGSKALINDGRRYSDFVREQSETDLLVYAALQEGVLSRPEARLALENHLRQAIANYYLFVKIRTPDSDFRVSVSEQEIEKQYAANRKYYDQLGLTPEQTRQLVQKAILGARREGMQEDFLKKRAQLLQRLKETAGYRLRPGQ